MEWSQENIKSWFLNKSFHVLMYSKKENLRLIAILNLFENKIEEYQIKKDTDNIVYFSTFDIDEAIDRYFEIIEGAKKNG